MTSGVKQVRGDAADLTWQVMEAAPEPVLYLRNPSHRFAEWPRSNFPLARSCVTGASSDA